MEKNSVIEYKCPCCNAGLRFDAKSGNLVCDYCDNVYTTEQMEEIEEAHLHEASGSESLEWDAYHGETVEGLTEYVCESCGARVTGDETTAATFCVYCGNPVVLRGKVEGEWKPDFVIPFKLTEKEAKEKLRAFYKGKILLPSGFKDESNFEKIKGIYVPFWLFDCDTHAKASYNTTRVTTWRSGNYRYTKTSHYLVQREADLSFERIPVDASEKMDDSYMDALEPFHYDEMVPFDPTYFPGFFADRYDVSDTDSKPRAADRVLATAETKLRETVHGYATVVKKTSGAHTKKSNVHYAMLPVYVLNTKYRDKNYLFMMNGQTGKMVGKLPVSFGRAAALFGGIAAVVMAIAQLFIFLL